jgi:hypothetical protein
LPHLIAAVRNGDIFPLAAALTILLAEAKRAGNAAIDD